MEVPPVWFSYSVTAGGYKVKKMCDFVTDEGLPIIYNTIENRVCFPDGGFGIIESDTACDPGFGKLVSYSIYMEKE